MASATRVGRLLSIHTKNANGIFATTYLRKTQGKGTGEKERTGTLEKNTGKDAGM